MAAFTLGAYNLFVLGKKTTCNTKVSKENNICLPNQRKGEDVHFKTPLSSEHDVSQQLCGNRFIYLLNTGQCMGVVIGGLWELTAAGGAWCCDWPCMYGHPSLPAGLSASTCAPIYI